MPKDKKNKPQKHYPFVSVCTPTYNRRPFIPTLIECFKNQTYPKYRVEWIILDDGTDKVGDMFDEDKIPQVKYFSIDEKITLGKKRNLMHEKCKGSIIVYMDDDDYYPPERISHAVEKLQKNPKALCAGSSELHIYFNHINELWQMGPYNAQHATAGTFAFRKELLNITKYNEGASLAEEKEFLHNYTIPFVQLDSMKTILVFAHDHNTYDKKKMLINPNEKFTKKSSKKVEHFIKNENEDKIKKFFVEEMDKLLEEYPEGKPDMKPDVLKQIEELEEKRKIAQEKPENNQIMVQKGNGESQPLTLELAVEIINNQQQDIMKLKEHIKYLESVSKKEEVELVE